MFLQGWIRGARPEPRGCPALLRVRIGRARIGDAPGELFVGRVPGSLPLLGAGASALTGLFKELEIAIQKIHERQEQGGSQG